MNLKRQPPFWIILLLLLRYIFKRFQQTIFGTIDRHEVDVRGKVVVITGGNSGLGKMTTIEMAKRGAIVVMGCRNISLGKEAVDEISKLTRSTKLYLLELDLANFTSVRKFSSDLQKMFPKIDILINNAGFFDPSEKIQYTKDNFEKHFAINYLGHFLLTNLVLPNLKKAAPSRVVTIGSTSDFIEELCINDLNFKTQNGTSGYGYLFGRIFGKAYATSKFASNIFSYELGQRLKSTGVTTYTLCPGMVSDTGIFREHGPLDQFIGKIVLSLVGLSPEQGVETILFCALSKLCAQETGQFYQFCELHPYENYRNLSNSELSKILWDESEKLVGLK